MVTDLDPQLNNNDTLPMYIYKTHIYMTAVHTPKFLNSMFYKGRYIPCISETQQTSQTFLWAFDPCDPERTSATYKFKDAGSTNSLFNMFMLRKCV